MPPDPLTDDEEQYASADDSDFAPEDGPQAGSGDSDSEDDAAGPAQDKQERAPDAGAEADGYNNSGDEAIIEKGKKKRKRAKGKDFNADEDEGGEGGLIKTRRQRAAEKEERKYAVTTGPVTVDVDALWAQMISGKAPTRGDDVHPDDEVTAIGGEDTPAKPSDDPSSNMIRIKRTYNFAGRIHTEEKLVARDSAEAKLYLASQDPDAAAAAADAATDALPEKRITRPAFRSAFEPMTEAIQGRADLNLGMAARMAAAKEAQAKKLNTVEKSRMDWAGYVDKEGIKDELELAGKSKDSYAARQDFLARSEAVRDDDARKARMSGRV